MRKKASCNRDFVSVIMPVYNAEAFVAKAIESILAQTYPYFELIIVDDASTDSSLDIIESYRKKQPDIIRVISLASNMNKGGDACANVAYKVARGSYIARMDADDIAHPERLEKQVKYMRTHPEVVLLGSQAYVIDIDSNITGMKKEPITHDKIYRDYCMYHPIIHPTVMLRKSLLPKRKNLYKTTFNANNDLLTFFGLLQKGIFANLEEPLLYYRLHGANDSLIHPKQRYLNTIKIRWHAIRKLDYRPTAYGIIINIVQACAVLVLPERLLMYTYMKWKGLSTISSCAKNMKTAPSYV